MGPQHQATEIQTLETRRVLSVTILDASLTEPDAGQVVMDFTLQRTANLSPSHEIDYATKDGTAIGPISGPAMPTVTLSVSPATITENGGVATFTATLSAPAPEGGVTVELSFTGTATRLATPTDPEDYTDSGTQIVIAAGATTGTVTVTAVADVITDPDETIIVDITSVTGAIEADPQQATVTISEPSQPTLPTVTLSVSPATIAENGGVATFTATLSAPAPAGGVTVNLDFTGTATRVASPIDPEDYTASGTQIVIAAGATTGTVTVTAVADAITDPDETIIVDITSVTGATETGTQQATVTISEPSQPTLPSVALSVGPATITENGGAATFTATLSAPAPAGGVTVELGFAGTATFIETPTDQVDYTRSGTQILIAAGATTGTVTVTAVPDAITDPDETIIVDITSVTGATETGTQQATVTISEPSQPTLPTVTLSVGPATITENGGVATFTATLSAPAPTGGVAVNLDFAGTATRLATPTDPEDYTASGTQITIAAGATTGTVTVTAVADTITDPGETIIVDITSVTGATETGTQQATVTISEAAGTPPGDMDGDGQVTTQDGNLVTLILLGASDSVLEGLKTPGSTATAAQIKASFESNKSKMDVDNNGTTQSQDGNLIVLVKLGASNAILELLRGPANTPDTRNNAAQIKTFVQNLGAPPAALASTIGFAAAVAYAPVSSAKVSVPVISIASNLFQSGSTEEAIVMIHPQEKIITVSDKESVDAGVPTETSPLSVATVRSDESVDESDLFFEALLEDNLLLQAL